MKINFIRLVTDDLVKSITGDLEDLKEKLYIGEIDSDDVVYKKEFDITGHFNQLVRILVCVSNKTDSYYCAIQSISGILFEFYNKSAKEVALTSLSFLEKYIYCFEIHAQANLNSKNAQEIPEEEQDHLYHILEDFFIKDISETFLTGDPEEGDDDFY